MSTYKINSYIEGIKCRHGRTVIIGWAFGAQPSGQARFREIQIDILEKGRPVADTRVTWTQRPDIMAAFFSCSKNQEQDSLFGFRVSFPFRPGARYQMGLEVEGEKGERVSYDIRDGQIRETGWRGLEKEGKQLLKRILGRTVSEAALAGRNRQYREEIAASVLPSDPLISLIVPVYRPEPADFIEMVESVLDQTYGKWELCLADGSEPGEGETEDYGRLAAEVSGRDCRVRYQKLEKNLGISGNTNAALQMASGTWIAMMDHDDLLDPDALWESVKALRNHPKAGFLYTDSDLTDGDGMKFYNPLLKPDWSPEMMYSANYITHFSMIRKDIIEKTGGFDSRMDGAQDWDIFLKAAELSEEILHVPSVLYHWRMAQTSTARSVETKPYALDAQLRAIQAHFQRMGWQGAAYFQDRSRYLIRVRWDRPVAWRLVDAADRSWLDAPAGDEGEGQAEAGQAEPEVYLVSFGQTEPADEDAYQELAQWAVHDGIGLVFPKLLNRDGTIRSAGVIITGGSDGVLRAETLYQGTDNHTADDRGNTDWYRNVRMQEPALFAVSAEHVRQLGFLREGDEAEAMAEYAFRLSRAGLRHLMNPFSEVVCGAAMPADAAVRAGKWYIRLEEDSRAHTGFVPDSARDA